MPPGIPGPVIATSATGVQLAMGLPGPPGATGPAGTAGARGANGVGVAPVFGPAASRPAATGSGDIYYCTDLPNVVYIDSPATSSWRQMVNGEYTVAPPLASAATLVGKLGVTQLADVLRACSYQNQFEVANCCLWPQSLPASGLWTVTLVCSMSFADTSGYPEVDVVITNGVTSGTSNAYAMGAYASGGVAGLSGNQFTVGGIRNVGAPYNQQSDAVSKMMNGSPLLHLRLLNDGTNLYMQQSNDAFTWSTWYAIASPGTYSYYGFQVGQAANASGNTITNAMIYECLYAGSAGILHTTVTGFSGSASGTTIDVVNTAGFQTGDWVGITNVGGSGGTVPNTGVNAVSEPGNTGSASFVAEVVDGTHLFLAGLDFTGTYSSGGTVTCVGR